MKKRDATAVATGNHKKGYNGWMMAQDADGKEREVLPPCDHLHKTTEAARTCATLRYK